MNPRSPESELTLQGLAVSDGLALAPARLVHPHEDYIPFYSIDDAQVAGEQARINMALAEAERRLGELVQEVGVRIGEAQAKIFVAQQVMVTDTVLQQEMLDLVANAHINAEAAIAQVLDRYEAILLEVENEYIHERASDIAEVRRQLIQVLAQATNPDTPIVRRVVPIREPHILVADELMPSDTVTLSNSATIGIVTERGGPGSHAAILARSLGIPAVSGVRDALGRLHDGDMVLLNGSSGQIVLRPAETTIRLYPSVRRKEVAIAAAVPPVPGLRVLANISMVSEVDQAVAQLAEGIGLYRTEFECLAAGRLLDEDEQYERYVALLHAMRGRPVHVRLFDFGGDKPAPFLDLAKEDNPALGFRGARLLQHRTDLLISQGRALARASLEGTIHIIYPMIVDLEQFLRLREVVLQHTADIKGARLKHGVMFEVPAACLQAEALLRVADFGSVGSNDLLQYLFAVDRDNVSVAYDYSPDRPVFWKLLEDLAASARRLGKQISLCGEIGGQPKYVPRLLDLGYECVSVSPRLIGLARRAVMSRQPGRIVG